MFLKEVSRIQALLCVYFFVLLVECLLERELRRAMEGKGIEELALDILYVVPAVVPRLAR